MDLFAVGSTIYNVMTGRPPYHDLEDDEVDARFGRREYPEVDGLLFEQLILGCWKGTIPSARVLLDIVLSESKEAI